MTSIQQHTTLTANLPSSQQWEVRPSNTYTTIKVTSFDELKAKMQMGGLRPAVQTSKGLLVRKIQPNNQISANTQQWCFITLYFFHIRSKSFSIAILSALVLIIKRNLSSRLNLLAKNVADTVLETIDSALLKLWAFMDLSLIKNVCWLIIFWSSWGREYSSEAERPISDGEEVVGMIIYEFWCLIVIFRKNHQLTVA